MASLVAVETALFEIEPDFTSEAWRVKVVGPETIASWVLDWHYAGRYPSPGPIGYGVFAPDMVALVVTTLGANSHGVAKRYGLASLPGNVEIARVVAHPSAPKNTASRAIASSPARPGYLANGREVHPRSLVSHYGTQAWPKVRELAAAEGVDLVRIDGLNTAKHTYILPVGTRAERRLVRTALAKHTKPYPKRSDKEMAA